MSTQTPPEVLEQWRKDWDEQEPRITYRNDPDCGTIDFYIDDEFATTWCYEDNPLDALEEFRKVSKLGFMISRQSLVIQLPKPIVDYSSCTHESDRYRVTALVSAIESQGYRVDVNNEYPS